MLVKEHKKDTDKKQKAKRIKRWKNTTEPDSEVVTNGDWYECPDCAGEVYVDPDYIDKYKYCPFCGKERTEPKVIRSDW